MIEAVYFDGRSAQRRDVLLTLDGSRVRVRGDGVDRDEAIAAVSVSSRVGRTPRSLRFADGALCEVRDHLALESLLREAADQGAWLHRAETNWRVIALAILIVALCGTAVFVWGIPYGAQLFAKAMPPSMSQALSDRTMNLLDRNVLKPTKLDPNRSAELTGEIEALRTPDGVQAVSRVEFRSSPTLGANAFALPDGTIVLLDELVQLADNDEQLLAVVGHEVGHVHYRHGLRLVAQSSAVGVLAAWWLGDVSTILATAPTMLLQARYSRVFEAEADRYAAKVMRSNHIPSARLAEILRKLNAAHPGTDEDGIAGLLASHPGLQERASALEAEKPPQASP